MYKNIPFVDTITQPGKVISISVFCWLAQSIEDRNPLVYGIYSIESGIGKRQAIKQIKWINQSMPITKHYKFFIKSNLQTFYIPREVLHLEQRLLDKATELPQEE